MLSVHANHFDRLDRLLASHRALWQIQPFHHRTLCWELSHPALCDGLLALEEGELKALEADETARDRWLAPWLGSDLPQLRALSHLDPLPRRPLAIPPRLDTGIPGRKWVQITAFAATLPAQRGPLLEWCAGKGHLGRLLALVDGRPVVSLERDGALCAAGRDEAARAGVGVQFVQGDALDPASARWLPETGQAVALHACGDLHTALMRLWAASPCPRLTLSPCCYHLTRDHHYRPLSRQAQASPLRLSRLDLGLAVRETVTGGQGAARRRHTEVLWRLAFDEWQRAARGCDHYQPLPAFAKGMLSGSFTDFCRWAATAKGLAAPAAVAEQHWLTLGHERLDRVRRMELVSQVFRRPLEVWLALDRVCYLEEQGAQVRLGVFCDKPTTPRNILIDAARC